MWCRHLIGGRRLIHSLSLQLGDLGLQQVDHLLVVHLHPPRLLLSRLGQLDPSPQSPTLLRSELDLLRRREEEEEREKEGSEGGQRRHSPSDLNKLTDDSAGLGGVFRTRSQTLNPHKSFKVLES